MRIGVDPGGTKIETILLNEAGEELAREPSRSADGRRAYASLRWSLCMTEWPAA